MHDYVAMQVKCPYCGAAQALVEQQTYVCAFCLKTFAVRQAHSEAQRLADGNDSWVRQRTGGASVVDGSIDVVSRAHIFRVKLLPDLRRDLVRALEVLGDYARAPLVEAPYDLADSHSPGHPLLALRSQVLALRELRSRFTSEQIAGFAVNANDAAILSELEQRLSRVIYSSNVVAACVLKSAQGYATARRNLDELAAATQRALAHRPGGASAYTDYLSALLQRYRALSEACRVYEAVVGRGATHGPNLTGKLERAHDELLQCAQQLEHCSYEPLDTLPLTAAIRHEAQGCAHLRRWLQAYDAITDGSTALSFRDFVGEFADMAEVVDDAWLGASCEVIEFARGQRAAYYCNHFAWAAGWAERNRGKKSLGLFGQDERVADAGEFFVPLWLFDISFSMTSGSVFKQGVESFGLGLVDACGSREPLLLLDEPRAQLLAGLSEARLASNHEVAWPRCSSAEAYGAVLKALRSRSDVLNAVARLRGLAYLPASWVSFEAKRGVRTLVACLNGSVPVDGAAVLEQLAATRKLRHRFG